MGYGDFFLAKGGDKSYDYLNSKKMMGAATFNRLMYLDTLQAGGIPELQARAHANALNGALHESVATKGGIGALKGDMTALRFEFKMNMEILRRDLTIRMGAMMMALGGVLIAVKYFG